MTIDIKERALLYKETKTYTYIKEISGINNRVTFYNGFIIEVNNNYLLFFDIKLKITIPITLNSIEVLEPTRKFDIDYNSAIKLLLQYQQKFKNDNTETITK